MTSPAVDLDTRSASFLDDSVDPATVPDPVPVGEQTDGALPSDSPPAEPKPADGPKADKTGRLHGERGKFVPKGDGGTRPIKGGTVQPEPEPAAAPAEPAAAAPAPAPADDLPAPEPFKFRAWGQDVEIPGAQYIKGHGAFIPEAQIADIRQAWARNMRHDHVVGLAESARQEAMKAKAESAAERAQWGVVAQSVTQEWLTSLGVAPENAAAAMRALALDVREAQIRAQASVPKPDGLPPTVTDGDLAQGFDGVLDQMAARPEFADALADAKLGPEIRDELRQQRTLFQVPWEALPPAEQQRLQQMGFPAGVPVVDTQKLHQRIQTLAARFQKFVTAPSPAPAASPVARRNAAPTPSSAPPPPATATPQVAGNGAKSQRSRTPSHFNGKNFVERQKAVRDWWNDPDAT